MRFDVISIFPQLFEVIRQAGVVGRAIETGRVDLQVWNPRDFSTNKHKSIDDRPYGGGPGMVLQAEPVTKAIVAARLQQVADTKVIYLSPQGRKLDHAGVLELAKRPGLILLAGRYEGIDERVLRHEVDEEWSLGDYVLSGGELPAMVLMDTIIRQLPGVLGDAESANEDSFVTGLLDYPHYTRPEVYNGEVVPEVLLSGDHAAIQRWRLKQSLGRTWLRRPDLLEALDMNQEQRMLLDEFIQEYEGLMQE